MNTARRLAAALSLCCLVAAGARAGALLIEDVTIIDGTGAAPLPARHVLVEAGRITAIAGAEPGDLPASLTRIDGSGRFLVPGFIDNNVHASVYGKPARRDTVVRYAPRNEELVEEFLQRQLAHGVTTVRDSYGHLAALQAVRDRIERGETVGSRLLAAGNILGWGGPFSLTFALQPESELTLFQEQWNDTIAQGAGEELMDMTPDELRAAVNTYLDKGPDFIKYGGTSHFRYPSLIGFSPRAQRVIVEETHRRGLIAETHATSSEALRIAVEAGIDFIQHPEILSAPYPQSLIDLIVERDVICGLRSNTLTGAPWRAHVERRAQAIAALTDAPPPATSAERRRREARTGHLYQLQRDNAERLIAAGCRIAIATDNYQGRAPEFRREPKPEIQEAGIGSILAIEGLVELGLSPLEAIVAATRNGALAAGMADELGTVEVGKRADLVLLEDDPIAAIGNIRRRAMVIARGRIVDVDSLPRQRIFSTAAER